MTANSVSLDELVSKFVSLKKVLDLEPKRLQLEKLQKKSMQSDFWSDEQKAREIMQSIAALEELLTRVDELETKLNQLTELEDLVVENQDKQVLAEIADEKHSALKKYEQLKIESYLSGKYDNSDAIVSIHAGQGGTEAMDWASMLQRMYLHYFDKAGYTYQIVDSSAGEEAGIKSVTIIVKGDKAYGHLKGEAGTHRLVRLSPFNADNLRQTSFAGVEVTPLIQNSKQVEIKDEDLDWQFFRSGGSGGQNVNKVNTAVRVKHKPSGLVVVTQSERTQVRNRDIALEILASKLEKIKADEEEKKANQIKGEHKIAGWGNQIRNYVLHPYQLVKDVRTGVETSQTESVLNGDLDLFIEAEIAWIAQELNQTSN